LTVNNPYAAEKNRAGFGSGKVAAMGLKNVFTALAKAVQGALGGADWIDRAGHAP
jgi:hypothetical protein